MIRIDFNDSEVQAGLDALRQLMADMTPVFEEIGEQLARSTKQRFEAGEDPEGTAWLPKSQTTLDRYARGTDPVSTRPLHGPSLDLSRQIYHEASREQALVGSARPYAAMMHFGGARAEFPHLWGDIPARPFLGLSDRDRSDVAEIIGEWLLRAGGGIVE